MKNNKQIPLCHLIDKSIKIFNSIIPHLKNSEIKELPTIETLEKEDYTYKSVYTLLSGQLTNLIREYDNEHDLLYISEGLHALELINRRSELLMGYSFIILVLKRLKIDDIERASLEELFMRFTQPHI